MVTFVEKPRDFQGFFFRGGYAGENGFTRFMMWAYDRGYIAAYQPDSQWISPDDADGQPPRHIKEMVHICRRGYIKGTPGFTEEMFPNHWFIIGPNHEVLIMTPEAVAERFRADDLASSKEFERIQLLRQCP